MSFFNSIMNALGAGNMAGGAQDYLGQTQGAIGQYLDPYSNAGQDQLPILQEQFGQLLGDPGSFLNQIGGGYQASPGYQYNVDQATGAATNAAAASGQAGSPAVQQALAEQISGMASQDYNQWLNQALGLYGQGLGGTQNLAGMGLQAGNTQANAIAQALQQQAGYDFAGQQQNAQSAGGLLGGIGGLFGGLF